MKGLLGALTTLLDVTIVYYLIYRVLVIIKGTRAVPMLVGLVAIVLLFFLSQEAYINLPTFNWLLEQFINSLFLIVVVLFQADIRRALAAFGRTQFLTAFRTGQGAQVIDELVKGCDSLARHHIGGLVVVEREADLSPYMEDSTRIDAKLSKELLYALFVPERQNPLHDGAVVIRNGRVEAAGVFLPMSVDPNIDRTLGTRHRAALGIAEETDAVVLVVSEERGTMSLAVAGRLEQDLGADALRERLTDLLIKQTTRLEARRRVRALRRMQARGELAEGADERPSNSGG